MENEKPTVTSFISSAITKSGKTHRQIANEAGFEKPNIISMFKHGTSKIPINRIPALSQAIGVDAADLLAIAMEEYQPEVWKVIKDILVAPGTSELSNQELTALS